MCKQKDGAFWAGGAFMMKPPKNVKCFNCNMKPKVAAIVGGMIWFCFDCHRETVEDCCVATDFLVSPDVLLLSWSIGRGP